MAERARRLEINISAAARDGVAATVRETLAKADRAAYKKHPERSDALHTVSQSTLTRRVGSVGDASMREVCRTLGC